MPKLTAKPPSVGAITTTNQKCHDRKMSSPQSSQQKTIEQHQVMPNHSGTARADETRRQHFGLKGPLYETLATSKNANFAWKQKHQPKTWQTSSQQTS
jgi:hypothetical protein